jgi:hypothetical protein
MINRDHEHSARVVPIQEDSNGGKQDSQLLQEKSRCVRTAGFPSDAP